MYQFLELSESVQENIVFDFADHLLNIGAKDIDKDKIVEFFDHSKLLFASDGQCYVPSFICNDKFSVIGFLEFRFFEFMDKKQNS